MTQLSRPRPIVLRIISAPPGEISPQPLRLAGGRATIGRRDGSSWVLPDASAGVSREHAVIEETHNGWQIVDRSANGTFVNGQNVGNGNAWPLGAGDSIRIGGYQIAVELEDFPSSSDELPAIGDDPFAQERPPAFRAHNDAFGDLGDNRMLPEASPFDGARHDNWGEPVGMTDPLTPPQPPEHSAFSNAPDPLASPPDPFDQQPLAPKDRSAPMPQSSFGQTPVAIPFPSSPGPSPAPPPQRSMGPPPAEHDPIEAALAPLAPAPQPTASQPRPQATSAHPPPPPTVGMADDWVDESSTQQTSGRISVSKIVFPQTPTSVPSPPPPAPSPPPAPTMAQVGAAPRYRRSWWQAALSVLRPARSPRRPDAAPPVGGGAGDTVVSVFAPSRIAVGSTAMIQVFLHLQEQAGVAMEAALAFDDDATRRAARTLAATIPVGTPVQIALTIPGLTPSPTFDVIVWNRQPESAQFSVAVPASRVPETAVGVVRLSVGGVPIGELRFKIAITAATRAGTAAPAEVEARRYHRAFASYASPDRAEVLRRVQMLRRVGVEVFQDVLDLEPGQRWERELYRHIDECDVVLLFWSTAARDSEWVAREIDYAIARQRRERTDDNSPDMPAIEPLPIEGPPIPAPPDKLKHLHFNDALLYAIAGEDRTRGR